LKNIHDCSRMTNGMLKIIIINAIISLIVL
jgi:hypothetical protein